MTRLVFYGFGAYITNISGPTTCSWFPDDPAKLNWDPRHLITVDLSATPSRAKAGSLQASVVQVDDSVANGGLTRIGPQFPGGVMVGACWLERGFYTALAGRGIVQPAQIQPSDSCHDYELTAIVDLATDRRFLGFHAKIVGVNPPLSFCSIWNGGTAVPGHPPAGTWWLDLRAVADPASNGFTKVAQVNDEGALFLDAATIKLLRLFDVKKPIGQGRGSSWVSASEI